MYSLSFSSIWNLNIWNLFSCAVQIFLTLGGQTGSFQEEYEKFIQTQEVQEVQSRKSSRVCGLKKLQNHIDYILSLDSDEALGLQSIDFGEVMGRGVWWRRRKLPTFL